MKKPKFLRRTYNRYPKLGGTQKSKRSWRNPTGRHNKLREKRRGYTMPVTIGYKNSPNEQNMFEGKKLVMIYNIKELEKLTKDQAAIIAKVGKKKKSEIAKKAKELKIVIQNLNVEKFLKNLTKKNESK
ncbi:50S ribosomal protein L32e [Candidatus Pacearchaeota archaeon]|nr:50S ribosomal protein L32e [Candidatus Pacearchaeota archaeon]